MNPKFELCLPGITQTEAWKMKHIIEQIQKDKTNMHKIYQMIAGDESTDVLIDYDLMDHITHMGCYPGTVLQEQGIRTDAELVEFVYNHNPCEKLRLCGHSCVAAIAAYMNIQGLIPEGSGMSDVIDHLSTGYKKNILRMAESKCRSILWEREKTNANS